MTTIPMCRAHVSWCAVFSIFRSLPLTSKAICAGMSAAAASRPMALHTRILLGLVVGATAGVATSFIWGAHPNVLWVIHHLTEPVGQLFLRLLLMTVLPLVFASLVSGVAGLGDLRKLGRVGLKSFGYCLVISALSVVIGITLVNTIRPGKRLDPQTADALKARYGADAAKRVADSQSTGAKDAPLLQVVKTLVPANPVAAVAGETPNMLHLMCFAVLLGVGLTMLPGERAAPVLAVMDGLSGAAAKLIDLIMKLAPYAVGCLVFSNTAQFGLDLLFALFWFVLTLLLGLSLHMFGVYSLSVWFLSRIRPLEFFRRIKTVMLTAFSTSSSAATLPTTLRVTEENLRVPREINSFVLTVGATANQNGTALYEGVTVLFLAQLAGVELTLGQQVIVAYLALLGGIGTAGVPSGSIPFIVVVLANIQVNPGLIAIILGVDRLLDMCRTVLNVTGDITAATYVARSEGSSLIDGKEAEPLKT